MLMFANTDVAIDGQIYRKGTHQLIASDHAALLPLINNGCITVTWVSDIEPDPVPVARERLPSERQYRRITISGDRHA